MQFHPLSCQEKSEVRPSHGNMDSEDPSTSTSLSLSQSAASFSATAMRFVFVFRPKDYLLGGNRTILSHPLRFASDKSLCRRSRHCTALPSKKPLLQTKQRELAKQNSNL